MTVQDWFTSLLLAFSNVFQGIVSAIQHLFGCGGPPNPA